VGNATAAAKIPEGNSCAATMVNFRFMANVVWSTKEALKQIEASV
jgi:hypothetical protein